jgi:hypothetical protein
VLAHAQVDNFRRQFDHLDNGGQGRPPGPNLGQATSLPRERVREFQHEAARYMQVGGDSYGRGMHASRHLVLLSVHPLVHCLDVASAWSSIEVAIPAASRRASIVMAPSMPINA